MTGALSSEHLDWQWRPAAGEWSLTELVCHLRDVELEVHQVRFKAVLRSPGVFLAGVSADEWADQRNYWRQDGPKAAREFLAARRETVNLLASLPGDAWALEGQHAFFGRTTLHELLFMMVRHDELHWEQIKTLIQAQSHVAQKQETAGFRVND
ncbi:MAG: DinB family protein [Candidatus Promineifilaceae bacterium]|nr:DinB family protein [Candidatus Promineifilaceae bacterium]